MSLVWNPPPDPPERRLSDVLFNGDVQVAAWRARRQEPVQAHEDPSTLALSQNALTYILMEIESRRGTGSRLDDDLHAAMVKYTPQLSVGGRVEALAHVFAQPEMQAFGRSGAASAPSPLAAPSLQTPRKGASVDAGHGQAHPRPRRLRRPAGEAGAAAPVRPRRPCRSSPSRRDAQAAEALHLLRVDEAPRQPGCALP